MDLKMEIPLVGEILRKDVIVLKEEFSAFDAIKCFNQYKISTAPVLDDNRKVLGYLSQSDCIKSISNCLFHDVSSQGQIKHIMTKKVLFAKKEWDIFELETFFTANHFRTAPIVDSENRLLGIVTRRDALLALEKCMKRQEKHMKELNAPIKLNLREQARENINNL